MVMCAMRRFTMLRMLEAGRLGSLRYFFAQEPFVYAVDDAGAVQVLGGPGAFLEVEAAMLSPNRPNESLYSTTAWREIVWPAIVAHYEGRTEGQSIMSLWLTHRG